MTNLDARLASGSSFESLGSADDAVEVAAALTAFRGGEVASSLGSSARPSQHSDDASRDGGTDKREHEHEPAGDGGGDGQGGGTGGGDATGAAVVPGNKLVSNLGAARDLTPTNTSTDTGVETTGDDGGEGAAGRHVALDFEWDHGADGHPDSVDQVRASFFQPGPSFSGTTLARLLLSFFFIFICSAFSFSNPCCACTWKVGWLRVQNGRAPPARRAAVAHSRKPTGARGVHLCPPHLRGHTCHCFGQNGFNVFTLAGAR